MNITQNNLDDFSCKSGTLFLVDLAGSEKVAKTHVKGQQLDEAKGINKSLSTLGKVINALTDKKSTHIPYRESKLTRILTESLGGNAKTSLIITCSPSPYNVAETVSTLRFGTAARNIKNKPKVNKEYTVQELKLMVSKRDDIISTLKKRIKVLEEFIRENGLEMPSDENLAKLANKLNDDEFYLVSNEEDKQQDDEQSDHEDNQKDDSFEEEKEETSPKKILYDQYDSVQESQIDDGDDNQDEHEVEQKQQVKEIIKLVQNCNPDDKGNNQMIVDKYLELQKQLNIQLSQNKAQLDALSNMKEDYEVAKSKIEKYENKTEEFYNFKEKADEIIHKLQEEKQDFENEIELNKVQITSTQTELAQLKKLYASAQNRMKKYEETGTEILINETKENQKFRKDAVEGTSELKSQIKLLYDQVKEKDALLEKIQSSSELQEDLRQIIQQSQQKLVEKEKNKRMNENNSIIKQILLGDGDEQLIEDNDSCYLSALEVVDLMKKQKELTDMANKHKTSNMTLKSEVKKLQQKLNEVLSADNPDIQSIVDVLVNEK